MTHPAIGPIAASSSQRHASDTHTENPTHATVPTPESENSTVDRMPNAGRSRVTNRTVARERRQRLTSVA